MRTLSVCFCVGRESGGNELFRVLDEIMNIIIITSTFYVACG